MSIKQEILLATRLGIITARIEFIKGDFERISDHFLIDNNVRQSFLHDLEKIKKIVEELNEK